MTVRGWLLVVLLTCAACGSRHVVTAGADTQALSYPDISTTSTRAPKTGDVAVIVAIEDYAFLPDVPGAVDNAIAWENYLRNARGFSEVHLLTNQQAALEEIQRLAQQVAASAQPGRDLWFVFIGHGAALLDGSDGALIGMDAQQTIDSIGARSIAQNDLIATLQRGPQARTVLVLDTCFSGRSPDGKPLAPGTQPVISVAGEPRRADDTIVLSAARHNEVAGQLPGMQRPAFSYLLLGALRGWADDGDGQVTAAEAITWTEQQLRHVRGRQQTPSLAGKGDLVLAVSLGEADPGIGALVKAGGTIRPSSTATKATAQTEERATVPDGEWVHVLGGLRYYKPATWRTKPPEEGMQAALVNADNTLDVGFMFANVDPKFANVYFEQLARNTEANANFQRVANDRRTFGKLRGELAEFHGVYHGVGVTVMSFNFTTRHGAWTIRALFVAPDRDLAQRQFHWLLSTIVVD